MPMRDAKVPWASQPEKPTPIDWSHPITRGLVVCAIPVGPRFYECVTGQLSEAAGTVRVRAAVDGNRAASRRIVNPGTGSKLPNPTGADSIVGAYSVFAECSPEVGAVANQPIFASTEPSNGYGFMVGVDDAGAEFNAMRQSNLYLFNTGTVGSTSGQILLADSELYTHRVMWTWDTSTTRFYAKRALGTTVGGVTTAPTAASTRRGYFLTGVAGTVGQAAASLVLVWNRALSLAEYQALHDNPWQVFAPQTRARIWAPSAGGGGGSSAGAAAHYYRQL